MDEILRIPFPKQQFPDSAVEMLRVIDKVLRKWKSYCSSSRLFSRDLQITIDRYLFCLIEIKGTFSTKLSAVQELQLIDMLCTFFEDRKSLPPLPRDVPSAFDVIFCGQSDQADQALHLARCDILAKTISLAAQLRCGSLLTDTAAWMQKVCITPNTSRGPPTAVSVSPDVKMVCCRLVEDYCSAGAISDDPSLNSSLYQLRRQQHQRVILDLATQAPPFLPYIVASSMTKYDFFVSPPLSMLEVMTEWICTHPKLVIKPYKESMANKATTAAPPTFLRALSQAFGKLILLCLINTANDSNSSTGLYGRMQLGLMRMIESIPKSVPLPINATTQDTPCSIITARMVGDFLKFIQHQSQVANGQNLCYALFRALQMAVANKCYWGTKRDLEQALGPYLGDYPFLEFVLSQNF